MKTINDLFHTLSGKAQELGANDGDLPEVARKVRSLLISSGWGNRDGSLNFLSEADKANAVRAATEVVMTVVPRVVQTRALRAQRAKVGSDPTRLSASSVGVSLSANTHFVSADKSIPGLHGHVTPGTPCTKCNSPMLVVQLVNDKQALYCKNDRVVLPLV